MAAEQKANGVEKDRDPRLTGRLRLVSVVAAALIAAVVCWLLIQGGDDGTDTASTAPPASASTPAAVVDAADLTALSEELGHPLYWLGERSGARLELTREADGDVYVRYLTGDAEAGDPRASFVTVGTYPVPGAVAAVRRAAAKADLEPLPLAHGGIAFRNPDSPGNVYLAYPGADFQIEVFTPTPGEALRLVRTGQVAPVG